MVGNVKKLGISSCGISKSYFLQVWGGNGTSHPNLGLLSATIFTSFKFGSFFFLTG